jgi:hypothetical protein
MQWPKEKGQKDKQRSTKYTHKTKDRLTRTSLRTGGERESIMLIENQGIIVKLRFNSLMF